MKIEWHQSEMVSAIRDTMELLKEPQLSNSSCSHDLFYCMYFFDIGTLKSQDLPFTSALFNE